MSGDKIFPVSMSVYGDNILPVSGKKTQPGTGDSMAEKSTLWNLDAQAEKSKIWKNTTHNVSENMKAEKSKIWKHTTYPMSENRMTNRMMTTMINTMMSEMMNRMMDSMMTRMNDEQDRRKRRGGGLGAKMRRKALRASLRSSTATPESPVSLSPHPLQPGGKPSSTGTGLPAKPPPTSPPPPSPPPIPPSVRVRWGTAYEAKDKEDADKSIKQYISFLDKKLEDEKYEEERVKNDKRIKMLLEKSEHPPLPKYVVPSKNTVTDNIPSFANPCKDVLHNKIPGQQNSSNKIPEKPCQPCINIPETVPILPTTARNKKQDQERTREIKISRLWAESMISDSKTRSENKELKTKVAASKKEIERAASEAISEKGKSLINYMIFTDIRREENKEGLPRLPDEWELTDITRNMRIAEGLDIKHTNEKEIRMKELEAKEKELQEYIHALERQNENEKSKANNKTENLERQLHQKKKVNISKIIDRQNKRHKEEAENRLKIKEKEQKEREERQQEFEKRQNMKSASFCTFCELFQSFRGHYCHLFKRYIRIDTANLVLLEGQNLEEVEAIPKEGKTKGTAVIKSYATKTRMYQDMESLKLIKIKIEEEQKKIEKENKQRKKEMEEETEKKMAEEKRKVEAPILKEMKVIISEWQEQRKAPSTIHTNFLKNMTKWYENFQKKKEKMLGKEKSDDFSKLENELELLMEEQKGKVIEEKKKKEENQEVREMKEKILEWKEEQEHPTQSPEAMLEGMLDWYYKFRIKTGMDSSLFEEKSSYFGKWIAKVKGRIDGQIFYTRSQLEDKLKAMGQEDKKEKGHVKEMQEKISKWHETWERISHQQIIYKKKSIDENENQERSRYKTII